MVRVADHAEAGKRAAHVHDQAARGGVDDERPFPALGRRPADEAHHGADAVGAGPPPGHQPAYVGAVEGGDDPERVRHAEHLGDVVPDGGGGGGGDGQHRSGDDLAEKVDAPEGGAELVAPLRDAVRLVDGDEGDGGRTQQASQLAGLQALGGAEEEVEVAVGEVLFGAALGVLRILGGERGGAQTQAAGAVDLVLHERDERTDDQHQAGHHEGGELVAEGLAASGREDAEGVAAREDAADQLFLAGTEAGKAELVAQDGAGGGVGAGFGFRCHTP